MLKLATLLLLALLSLYVSSQINNDNNTSNSNFVNADKAVIDASISHIYPLPAWHDTTSAEFSTSVTVIIRNEGSDPIGNFQLRYLINYLEFSVDTFTNTINVGDSAFITFSKKYYSPIGYYYLTCDILLANDNDNSNDSVSIVLFGDNGLSIKEKIADNSFTVGQSYPNPVTNFVKINYYIPQSGLVYFSLYNTIGDLILSQHNELNSGDQTMQLDATKFPPGVYYYTVEYGNMRISHRMIINR